LKRFQPLKITVLLALALLAGALSGCSGGAASGEALAMAPLSEMPADVRAAPVTVQQSYQFAFANPGVLQEIPCYCGCGAMGHESNYDCYVAEVTGGQVTYDTHALGCSICVDITQDAMHLLREGKSTAQIRAAIDDTYSRYGPTNMEP
jgi:hypothetical protein